MPTWPTASFPFFVSQPSLQGSGPQNAVERTEMQQGPAKVRRLTSAAVKGRAGTTPGMTLAQFQAFEDFFANDLGMGALSFTATDPFDCVPKTFRFVGSYDVSRAGGKRYVSASLEILP